VWDLYEKLKELMQGAVEPLYSYLDMYEEYKKILDLNPDEEVRKLEQKGEENPDQPLTEIAIKAEILKYQKLEVEITASIPEEVHVSCFSINTKDLIGILAGRYSSMQKNLLELIAKRARERTRALFNDFQEMERRISKRPKTIKELTELNDYLDNIPGDMEKKKLEIDECMDAFTMVEEFGYKFPADELNKRWEVYGYPLQIQEQTDKRLVDLEKEKADFQENMILDREEFKDNIDNLEQTISRFHQHKKLDQHEETAKIAASVDD
jgi:dynein heavy chain